MRERRWGTFSVSCMSVDGLEGRHRLRPAIAASKLDCDLITDLVLFHEVHQVVDGLNQLAIHGDNNIAQFNAAAGGFPRPTKPDPFCRAPAAHPADDDAFDAPPPRHGIRHQ